MDFYRLLNPLLEPFSNPESRTYWVGLSATFLLVILYGYKNKQEWMSWKGFKSALSKPTHQLDCQLFIGRQLLFSIVGVPTIWSAWTISTHSVVWLNNTIGIPSPPPLSPELKSALYALTLFVVWDFSRFALHWLMHKVPALWAFHQVHHSATELSPLTHHRIHPVESVLYTLRGALTTGFTAGFFYWLFQENISGWILFGVPAIGFTLNVAVGNIRHSAVWMPYPLWLEKWLISPAQHHIHHSVEKEHYDQNLGTWLAVWDRAAGSWAPATTKPSAYGIDPLARNHKDDLISAWFGPIPGSIKRMRNLIPFGVGFAAISLLNVAIADEGQSSTNSDQKSDDSKETQKEDESNNKKIDSMDLSTEGIEATSIIVYAKSNIVREAGSAHSIDAKKLETLKQSNVELLVDQIPGVTIRSEDGYGLRPNIGIRGANSDRSAKITLMEDGILLSPAPYAAPAAYYFPMNARITGIEVFKGAAATRYGPQTVGGALNLLTRPINYGERGQIDYRSGLYGFHQLYGFGSKKNNIGGILLEGIHVSSDGFKQLDGGGKTGFAKSELMMKTEHFLSNSNILRIKMSVATETSNETYLGLTKSDWENSPYRRYASSANGLMKWNRGLLHVEWIAFPSDEMTLRTVGYGHVLSRAWNKLNRFNNSSINIHDLLATDPQGGQGALFLDILRGEEDTSSDAEALQIGTNNRRFINGGIQSTFRWTKNAKDWGSSFEAGLRFHADRVKRIHTESSHWMEGGSLNEIQDSFETILDSETQADALAVHFHENLRLGPFHLFPSGRVEMVNTDAVSETVESNPLLRTTFLPGFGAMYRANDALDIFVGIHRGFSPVSPGQSEEVQPETTWNSEAGIRYQQKELHLEGIGFFNDYENITGQCTFSSGCGADSVDDQFNGGAAWIYGFESVASQSLRLNDNLKATITGNYTWTDARFKTDFKSHFPQYGSVDANDWLPYIAKHSAGLSLSISSQDLELITAFSHRSEMLNQAGQFDDDELEIPSLSRLDMAMNYKIGKDWYLTASGTNLLNETSITSWRPFGARPTAPRQVMLGVKWDAAKPQ